MSSLPFHLLQKHHILVDPIRPSGIDKESGLYIIDQESDAAMRTSMLVHVYAIHPENDNKAILGETCVVPVYSWDDFEHEGEKYHYMNEGAVLAIIEGYEDSCGDIYPSDGEEITL